MIKRKRGGQKKMFDVENKVKEIIADVVLVDEEVDLEKRWSDFDIDSLSF